MGQISFTINSLEAADLSNKYLNTDPKGVWSALAETNDGQPLSLNRAPAQELEPWVVRVHATKSYVEPGQVITCGMLSDVAILRILFTGDWHAETADGPRLYNKAALLFGPHTKRMPSSVRGSFATVGIALAPGACAALNGPALTSIMDRILGYSELGYDESNLLARFDETDTPEQWVESLEGCMRSLIEDAGGAKPDPITRAFDEIALADPNTKVREFAEREGIQVRRLERIVKRDFGMSPKQVLRRARTLDMAAHLRGVADSKEAEEIALRYFDQSHLNRDFTALIGMTPVQFVRTPQPFMTMALEYRQARRVEALKRFSPNAIKPWQAPPKVSRKAS